MRAPLSNDFSSSLPHHLTGLLFVSVLGGLLGTVYLLFDPIVKHVLLSNLVLTNDTQFAEIWRNPPIAPHLKVTKFFLSPARCTFCAHLVLQRDRRRKKNMFECIRAKKREKRRGENWKCAGNLIAFSIWLRRSTFSISPIRRPSSREKKSPF